MRARAVRLLVVAALLSGAPAAADDAKPALLAEARGWRGVVELESTLQAREGDRSEEIQIERAEFFAVTDPTRGAAAGNVLPLAMARSRGEWTVRFDLREERSGRDVASTGAGSGRLDFSFAGTVDARAGTVVLRFGTGGQRLAVKTTLSGIDEAGLATLRSVAQRRSLLDGLVETGTLDEARHRAAGEREFEVKRGKFVRTVRIRWSLERLEPEVRGRITDQHGNPVPGLRVVARTLGRAEPGAFAETILLEARSGEDGRFSIPVPFGTWGVEVPGRLADGVLTRGWAAPDGAQVRFDSVPDLKIETATYVFARLPQSHLLERKFRGDVNRYMTYIERRVPAARLAAARVPKATATN